MKDMVRAQTGGLVVLALLVACTPEPPVPLAPARVARPLSRVPATASDARRAPAAYDCQQVFYCVADCSGDPECANDCYALGSAEAKAAFDALGSCLQTWCAGVSDSEFQDCANDHCSDPIDACMAPPTGLLSCPQVYSCLMDCVPSDGQCPQDCYGQGSTEAQQAIEAMLACLDQQCGSLDVLDQLPDCAYDACPDEVHRCFPPTDCPLTGGGCPEGEACFPAQEGHTDCGPSSGMTTGTSCDPEATDVLDCADGLWCVAFSAEATCRHLCHADADCPPGELCILPLFADLPGVGVCTCVDDDQDGSCVTTDCDEASAEVHPGAPETCNDGVDNDCNGATDEECAEPPVAEGAEATDEDATASSEVSGDASAQPELPGDTSAQPELPGDAKAPEDRVPAETASAEPETLGEAEKEAAGGGCSAGRGRPQATPAAGSSFILALTTLMMARERRRRRG